MLIIWLFIGLSLSFQIPMETGKLCIGGDYFYLQTYLLLCGLTVATILEKNEVFGKYG